MHLFEHFHGIGQIYNDLKLDNILVGDKDSSLQSLSKITLIDFGLCSSYLDKDGKHVKDEAQKCFMGNMAMASVNAMNFRTVSRRDDLISLCYLLIYMVQGKLKFLETAAGSKHDQMSQIVTAKNALTPQDLCKSSRAAPFI